MKTSNLLLMLAILFAALGTEGLGNANAQDLKPLETWGIKTADYRKAAAYWTDDEFYRDVLPPDCTKPVKDMKLLCNREDFQKLAWFTRKFAVYAEENARKIEIDHKKAHAHLYHSKCTNENCLGAELKKNFYQSMDDSGMAYILDDEGR